MKTDSRPLTGWRRWAGAAAAAAVALGLLLLADRLMAPVPIPAATALLPALAALLWRGRPGQAAVPGLVGAGAGVLLHGRQHWLDPGIQPPEGLVAHLALDAALGLGVAAVAFGAAVLVDLGARRLGGPSPS